MSRKRKYKKRKYWTEAEIKRLLHFYPYMQTRQLARVLGHGTSSCYQTAARHGVRKSKEFFERPELSGRTDGTKGISGRFKQGLVPWNKGMKGLEYPGSKPTQFKAGHKPQTWVPVGTEVVTDDGYLKRKISDDRTRPSRFNWKMVHVIEWEKHNGPVPKGHIVVFRNKDRSDRRIQNLELITLAENMRRNTIHNYPEPLKEVIRLQTSIKRRVKKHRRQDEQRQTN